MLSASGSDPYTILAVVFAAIFSLIGALTLIIFNDLRNQVKDNTRHLQGILATIGPLMWRVIMMEDWLEKHPGERYSPPRDMSWVDEPRRR